MSGPAALGGLGARRRALFLPLTCLFYLDPILLHRSAILLQGSAMSRRRALLPI
jgi:hypothetical protein